MRNFRRLVLGLVLVSLVTPLKAETVMYCVAELATGFILENGKWKQTNFKPPRYTIKFDEAYTELTGITGASWECGKTYDFSLPNMVVCQNRFSKSMTFTLMMNSGRFIYANTGGHGFISSRPDPDTDALIAGTCTKF
jgi:hypothetical protein